MSDPQKLGHARHGGSQNVMHMERNEDEGGVRRKRNDQKEDANHQAAFPRFHDVERRYQEKLHVHVFDGSHESLIRRRVLQTKRRRTQCNVHADAFPRLIGRE